MGDTGNQLQHCGQAASVLQGVGQHKMTCSRLKRLGDARQQHDEKQDDEQGTGTHWA